MYVIRSVPCEFQSNSIPARNVYHVAVYMFDALRLCDSIVLYKKSDADFADSKAKQIHFVVMNNFHCVRGYETNFFSLRIVITKETK